MTGLYSHRPSFPVLVLFLIKFLRIKDLAVFLGNDAPLASVVPDDWEDGNEQRDCIVWQSYQVKQQPRTKRQEQLVEADPTVSKSRAQCEAHGLKTSTEEQYSQLMPIGDDLT